MQGQGDKKSKGLLFLTIFVDLLGFGIMIPMLPFYAKSLGASAWEIGWLMASYSLFQFFFAPIWGRLSDQYGRRPILLATILGQSMAFFIAAWAPSLLWLIISRSFAGIFGGNIAVASAMMADLTSREDRAKGMGLIGAAFGLGFVFGPVIGAVLIHYGMAWPSGAAGVLALLNFLGASVYLREPIQLVAERARNRRRFVWAEAKSFLSRIEIFIPVLSFFFFTFAFVQLEVTFGLYVVEVFAYSERQAGLLLGLVGITMAVVQGGLLGIFNRWLGEVNLVLLGSFLLASGLVWLSIATRSLELFGSLFILALGYSLANPSLSSLLSKAAGEENYGSVFGIYQSSGSIARIIAPLVAGSLFALNIRYPMQAGALLIVGALGLWTAWRFILNLTVQKQDRDKVV